MNKVIEYKKSTFWCGGCQKMVDREKGYLIGRQAYCEKHYWEKFVPKGKEETK